MLVCELCAHYCKLKDGRLGICGVRKRIGNKLYTLVYGKAIASAIDPIEKSHFSCPAGDAFVLNRHDRMQFPVCVLPELGYFAKTRCRGVRKGPPAQRGREAGQAIRLPDGGIHLFRADNLFRVHLRHGKTGR